MKYTISLIAVASLTYLAVGSPVFAFLIIAVFVPALVGENLK